MKIFNFKSGEKVDIKKMLLDRAPTGYGEYEDQVNFILKEVRLNGDEAIVEFTKKFDGVKLTTEQIKVHKNEIKEAYEKVDEKLITVMKKAKDRIEAFHKLQKQNSWFDTSAEGELLGQRIAPIESVGIYVPGGKAVYPSSVLMNTLPAMVAGVERIVMVTPPSKDFDGGIHPMTLVAADLCGVKEIYKVGGAQAIAALAFGTESIPKVDKIVGPGNIFVALAKKAVYGHVSIDSIAGPSEILVIADETANPRFVAADLLSQAEHDELASSVLISTDESLAQEVLKEIEIQTNLLSRKEIIQASLDRYGAIIVVENIKEAVSIANDIAPEHLELCVKDSFNVMPLIKNAGAIFLGNYSPEPLGDYMAGPNHVLPTNGTAKFFSPLNVDDFVKKSSIISFDKAALGRIEEDIIYFAESEQLTAHANSIRVRFEK